MYDAGHAWITAGALKIFVPYDLLLTRIRAFEAQTDVAALSLHERVTLLRQLHADTALPFDDVIGTEEGERTVEDRPELGNLIQLLKGPVTGVVLPGGEHIDFAHFLITLDAYSHPDRQATYSPGFGLSGLPIGSSRAVASWSGDVGGAAGDYTVDHENRNLRHMDNALLDEHFQKSAPDADLLGNLDGMGARLLLQRNSGISSVEQLVRVYYEGVTASTPQGDPNPLRSHRAQALTAFLGSYGFADATNLHNSARAAMCILRETFLFARIWYMNRRGFSLSTVLPPDSLLMVVSHQMVQRFLDRLQSFAAQYGVGAIPTGLTRSVSCPALTASGGSGRESTEGSAEQAPTVRRKEETTMLNAPDDAGLEIKNQKWPISNAAVIIQRDDQGGQSPSASGPTCTPASDIQAPDDGTLKGRLITYGVLRTGGASTNFANILGRHIDSGTRIGQEYLQYLRDWAYPMGGFCIVYGGRGWNATFGDVLDFYHVEAPSHQAMQSARLAVENYAREHLYLYDESIMFPGGMRDPFVGPIPLTRATLQRKRRGTMLAGTAPEGVLLLLATDDHLSTLTLTAEMVSATTPEAVTSGSTTAEAIFAWGTTVQERTIGDPNRFDALIVHWTNYYNEIFLPLDSNGRANRLDPDLAKAMIYVESRFNEAAAGTRSSARGLTEVLGRERGLVGAMTAGVAGITNANFSDPGLQIAAGIRILFEKYRRSRNWQTAIRDYNGSAQRDQYAAEVWRVYEAHRRR